MKRLVGLFLITLTIFSLSVIPAYGQEAFYIDNYDVEIQVFEDNTYSVNEKIDVFFTDSRRGIYRTIPLYSSESDARVDGIKVKNDPYAISYDASSVEIRIGDPDIYITGQKTYEISYNFKIGEDGIPSYDEFYYNLIGDQWDTYINNASFTIEMPKEFDESNLSFQAGKFNQTDDTNSVDWNVEGKTIYAETNRKLSNYEAVTIVLVLPEGYYSEAKPLNAGINNYRYFMYGLAILLSLLTFFLWLRNGKDDKLVAPIQFYPPKDLTPAEVGYLIDETVDPKDVTSLIIYWASKGYLNIVEDEPEDVTFLGKIKNKLSKPKFTLVKLRDLDSDAKDFERIMFEDLFEVYGDGQRVTTDDLKQTFHVTMSVVISRVTAHFHLDEKRLYTKKSIRFKYLTHFLSIIPTFVFLTAVFSYEFYSLTFGLIIALLSSIFLTVPMGLLLRFFDKNKHMRSLKLILPALGVFVLAVPFIFVGVLIIGAMIINLADIIFIVFSILFMNLIGIIMPKRSEYGEKVMNEVLGFRTFILTAEKDRLERLISENSTYYYDVLAYAIVLNVSDKWADKFRDITIEPPDWYVSSMYYRAGFSAAMFNQHFTESFSTLQDTMASKPPSQRGGGSSFGGGSAGGGAGGGGGGSW
ncbi:MAG: DUF2207 domain-containing protein [Clostridia bacterium]